MKLPRGLSGRDLAKALQVVLGYQVTRQTGSHLRLTTTTHGEQWPRPRAGDVPARALARVAHKAPGHLVFWNAKGQGPDYRDVGEGFRAAVTAAGLTGPGRLSLQPLRHTFASLLIAKGLDVVSVSRQLGHASPATTLGVYAHLFDHGNRSIRDGGLS